MNNPDNPKSIIYNPKFSLNNSTSNIQNPKSSLNNPTSNIQNPKSSLNNPTSNIQNPKSSLNNPTSNIQNPKSFSNNPTPNYLIWHSHKVKKEDRERIKNQKGCVLWFTGLSGSGKSTIANEVEYSLNKQGYHTYLLDGDNLRHGLNKDLGFSYEDRVENIRRVAEVAKLFVDAGIIVLVAFISPFLKEREKAKEIIGKENFIEIFIDTPLGECIKRDPKGLYKKALNGEISEFTGIDSPYEPPENPDIHIKTMEKSVEQASETILLFLKEKGFLR